MVANKVARRPAPCGAPRTVQPGPQLELALPNLTAETTARTIALTAVAMIAFAANSLLCRAALGPNAIDAGNFAALRTLAGALTLALILSTRGKLNELSRTSHLRTGAMLFAYMVFFTFAYRSLSAGTGALILFGAVQLTMFAAALRNGEAFSPASWFGLLVAIAGLIYLVSPGLAAPEPMSALLMVIAGIAWGLYSLLGRVAADPLVATAGAFVAATPAVIAVAAVSTIMNGSYASIAGILLAIVSGAVASGCGYVIWYAALRGLTAARAATVQLSVPVIAAFGGVGLLGESVTLRLLVAAVATLGGVAIVLSQRAVPK